jgi:arylsulfatase A-like enzyme
METALLARHPTLEPGTRDELLSNVDLLPTVCEFLGIDVPDQVEGRSFHPLLAGDTYEERDHIFLEMTFHDKYNPVRGVRTNDEKYLRTFDDQPLVYLPLDILHGPAGQEMYQEYYGEQRPEEEFYDLTEDPLEADNRIDDPAYRAEVEKLRSRLDAWMERTDDPLLDGDVPVPPEHVEVLKKYPWDG